jgi:hypothetical protein
MCFVAMPFGRRSPLGKRKPIVDFDAVHRVIAGAVEAERLDCVRADFELTGGFVHKPMFERLLVAEYVVADLTFANANVAYELGVRHGGSIGATLVVCAAGWLNNLPFDHRPFRVVPYEAGPGGKLSPKSAESFKKALRARIRGAKDGERGSDNPIIQVTRLRPAVVGHEKTDVFTQRMAYVSDVGARVRDALTITDREAAVAALKAIEQEVMATADGVSQLHTAVLALYLGYRAKSAFDEMVALNAKMDPELRATAVTREQLALALNRLAEIRVKARNFGEADELRARALASLDVIPRANWSSETFGISGRIYKGQADAEAARDRPASSEASLSRAIEEYEAGFRADPRDTFPGVNAMTLRILRNWPEDAVALRDLLPVLRFCLTRAPEPTNEDERYWATATRLEIACAERDWTTASATLDHLLGLHVAPWMHDTTADNLQRQARARVAEPETVKELTLLLTKVRG